MFISQKSQAFDRESSILQTGPIIIQQHENQTITTSLEETLQENLLLFVLSGHQNIDMANTTLKISAGKGIIIPKGTVISTPSQTINFRSLSAFIDDQTFLFITKQYANLRKTIETKSAPHYTHYIFNQTLFMEKAIDSLQLLLRAPENREHRHISQKISEILTYAFDSEKSLQPIFHRHFFEDKNSDLREFMEDNFTNDWTIPEFARRFGYSLSTFKRAFKEAFNNTPHQWIRHKKLHLAAEKLTGTSMSLTDISQLLGFSDSSHFSKAFKNEFNRSPLRYRLTK